MNLARLFKLICLSVICALGASDIFGMDVSTDGSAKRGRDATAELLASSGQRKRRRTDAPVTSVTSGSSEAVAVAPVSSVSQKDEKDEKEEAQGKDEKKFASSNAVSSEHREVKRVRGLDEDSDDEDAELHEVIKKSLDDVNLSQDMGLGANTGSGSGSGSAEEKKVPVVQEEPKKELLTAIPVILYATDGRVKADFRWFTVSAAVTAQSSKAYSSLQNEEYSKFINGLLKALNLTKADLTILVNVFKQIYEYKTQGVYVRDIARRVSQSEEFKNLSPQQLQQFAKIAEFFVVRELTCSCALAFAKSGKRSQPYEQDKEVEKFIFFDHVWIESHDLLFAKISSPTYLGDVEGNLKIYGKPFGAESFELPKNSRYPRERLTTFLNDIIPVVNAMLQELYDHCILPNAMTIAPYDFEKSIKRLSEQYAQVLMDSVAMRKFERALNIMVGSALYEKIKSLPNRCAIIAHLPGSGVESFGLPEDVMRAMVETEFWHEGKDISGELIEILKQRPLNDAYGNEKIWNMLLHVCKECAKAPDFHDCYSKLPAGCFKALIGCATGLKEMSEKAREHFNNFLDGNIGFDHQIQNVIGIDNKDELQWLLQCIAFRSTAISTGKGLRTLWSSVCHLSTVPDQVRNIVFNKQHSRCAFADNQLTSLPDWFAELNVTHLDLDENNFTKIPQVLLKMPNLVAVDFIKNPCVKNITKENVKIVHALQKKGVSVSGFDLGSSTRLMLRR